MYSISIGPEDFRWLRKQILNSYYNLDYPENYCKIKDPQYIQDAKDYRIAAISDIKQNGPATIIFLKNGKKVVVKCQNNKQYDRLGLYMCLIKYLVENGRIYTACVDRIFNGVFECGSRTMLAESIILSHIESQDFRKIIDKFGCEED